jgi:hypothetical protein
LKKAPPRGWAEPCSGKVPFRVIPGRKSDPSPSRHFLVPNPPHREKPRKKAGDWSMEASLAASPACTDSHNPPLTYAHGPADVAEQAPEPHPSRSIVPSHLPSPRQQSGAMDPQPSCPSSPRKSNQAPAPNHSSLKKLVRLWFAARFALSDQPGLSNQNPSKVQSIRFWMLISPHLTQSRSA